MLYDPKWEKPEVKAKPLTLPHLIAWLETQPADKTYNYDCHDGTCLLDRYIGATTGKPSRPSSRHWRICGDEWGYNYTFIARVKPQTFGAALERARSCLATPRTDWAV